MNIPSGHIEEVMVCLPHEISYLEFFITRMKIKSRRDCSVVVYKSTLCACRINICHTL